MVGYPYTYTYIYIHIYQLIIQFVDIEGILPKGPYLACVSMAGRALLEWYRRYMACPIYHFSMTKICETIWHFLMNLLYGLSDILMVGNWLYSPCTKCSSVYQGERVLSYIKTLADEMKWHMHISSKTIASTVSYHMQNATATCEHFYRHCCETIMATIYIHYQILFISTPLDKNTRFKRMVISAHHKRL